MGRACREANLSDRINFIGVFAFQGHAARHKKLYKNQIVCHKILARSAVF